LILSEAVKMKSIYAVDRSGDGKQTLSVLRLFREVKKDNWKQQEQKERQYKQR
jgi:hypothetical protein